MTATVRLPTKLLLSPIDGTSRTRSRSRICYRILHSYRLDYRPQRDLPLLRKPRQSLTFHIQAIANGAVVLVGLITSAFASEKLDVLVNAAASFSATIQRLTVQCDLLR